MYCQQCGNEVGPSGRFCPACGASVPAKPLPPPPAPATEPSGQAGPPSAPTYPVTFDIKRLATGDIVVGASAIVVFVMLFLPWFSVSLDGFDTYTLDGLYQGWMYLVLILAIATVAYLLVRATIPVVRLPFPHWQLLTAATGLAFVLTLVGVLAKPAGTTYSWGGFVALAGTVAAIVGAVVRRNEPEHLAGTAGGHVHHGVGGQYAAGGGPYAAGGSPATNPPARPAPPAAGSSFLAPSPPATASGPEPAPTVDEPAASEPRAGHCSSCGADNPVGNAFCRSCGQALAATAD